MSQFSNCLAFFILMDCGIFLLSRNLLYKHFGVLVYSQMCNIFPFIMKLPGPQQEIFTKEKELEAFVKEEILEHKKSRQQAKPRDLIDAYLDKIDEVRTLSRMG